MSKNANPVQADKPSSVTGVQLAQGIGHQPAQSFWAEAWAQVFKRPAAVASIVWIAIVSFFAIYAPLIASSHPLVLRSDDGTSSPLIESLSAPDVALLVIGTLAPIYLFFRIGPLGFGAKLRLIIAASAQIGLVVVFARMIESTFTHRDAVGFVADWGRSDLFVPVSVALLCAITMIPFLLISIFVHRSVGRSVFVLGVAIVAGGIVSWKWTPSLNNFDYRARESRGLIDATYTVVPFSHSHSMPAMFNRPPGATPLDAAWSRLEAWQRRTEGRSARYNDEELASIPITADTMKELRAIGRSVDGLVSYPMDEFVDQLETRVDDGQITNLVQMREAILEHHAPVHTIGTDTLGQDVLSQMMHACRLAISIGFVSTGIAVVIGVTIGALMGYFGGWVDLLLYRVVEIFMAIPVLFLLIVAAGLLPRNTYVMMAIIGCFTWTGAARFIRAEFMKLRHTDYVQAAQAMGLPLWSILFKHMLPNGVTPVLVESSFLIAAAILIEATLSFLGLGPTGQASWGSLLRNASGEAGGFLWWLAIFPGAAIFLTTLAYNLIGEALRDAIDPKLKKARV
jgi:ABC-type dipeptide/oligopeptide/nickel transport system permease subunit